MNFGRGSPSILKHFNGSCNSAFHGEMREVQINEDTWQLRLDKADPSGIVNHEEQGERGFRFIVFYVSLSFPFPRTERMISPAIALSSFFREREK